MSAQIVVPAGEPADVEAIAEILNCPGVVTSTLRLPWQSLAAERERLGAPRDGVHRLVAELEGRVVGTLGLHIESNPRRRHCAGIGMAVHDAFQGRGVGTALLAAAIDLADNWLGLRRLELHVYPDNAAGIHLYQKFGFVVEGTARDFAFRNGRFVDALAMARLRPARPCEERGVARPPGVSGPRRSRRVHAVHAPAGLRRPGPLPLPAMPWHLRPEAPVPPRGRGERWCRSRASRLSATADRWSPASAARGRSLRGACHMDCPSGWPTARR